MLDTVARKDHDRAPLRKLTLAQGCRNTADPLQGFGIAQAAPVTGWLALCQENSFRRCPCPVSESFGELCRVGRERVGRPEKDGAVSAPFRINVMRTKPNRPHWLRPNAGRRGRLLQCHVLQ